MSEINSNQDSMIYSNDEEGSRDQNEIGSSPSQNGEVESLNINKNQKWTDRERVLLLCSRGSLARTRHLVNDLKRFVCFFN